MWSIVSSLSSLYVVIMDFKVDLFLKQIAAGATGKTGELFPTKTASTIYWNNDKENFTTELEIYDFAWTLCLKDEILRK